MKFLEKIIETVSPSFASKRQEWRARGEHFKRMEKDEGYRNTFFALMRTQGYRSAKSSRYKTPWLGGSGNADSLVLNDLPTLIARSREVNRDDPIASGIIKTFVRNVVGTGIRPQAKTDSVEANKKLEAIFNSRKDNLFPTDNLTFWKHQEIVITKVLEDGGVFVKQSRDGNSPVWFEIIEKDRVATPRDAKPADAQGVITDGVEKDKFGRPVAYWITKTKLDKPFAISILKEDFIRIPKEAIIHLRNISRPGQTHG
ncbi:MAG: phage portal protein, partial [Nanoarchaeota archaeon]|nr:phage portal protein [Nanoarchaeota archaeon]